MEPNLLDLGVFVHQPTVCRLRRRDEMPAHSGFLVLSKAFIRGTPDHQNTVAAHLLVQRSISINVLGRVFDLSVFSLRHTERLRTRRSFRNDRIHLLDEIHRRTRGFRPSQLRQKPGNRKKTTQTGQNPQVNPVVGRAQ